MTTQVKKINRLNLFLFGALLFTSLTLITSCSKPNDHPHDKNPSSYGYYVVDKWMSMQIRLMRNATGIPNHAFSRHFAYSGIAAFVSLRPGLTAYNQHFNNKWNGLSGLPESKQSRFYYYPQNVNAALARINKLMFPNASEADKAAIDSLQTALQEEFRLYSSEERLAESNAYGIAVANAVFTWSESDGYKQANAPYTIPVGPGLWKPIPPANAAPITPYWGNNRTVVNGSTRNCLAPAPIAYSTDPQSPFYQMVKQVYDVSQNLTEDQKAMAIFWRDIPGVTSPGHWVSILQQVIRKKNSSLDKATLAYALTGAGVNDALITCFKSKYTYNLVRPVTYIREVMGIEGWSPYIGTPAHPEYVSAHSALSVAAGVVMDKLFGDFQTFTDHTYDYLGLAPRTYHHRHINIGVEAGLSRLYAGIHYQQSIVAGIVQGKQVAENIFSNP